jgi:GntR family transcriptional regulator
MRSALSLGSETAVPLYVRIASILRSQIAEGTLPAGRSLPSIQDLCERYDVARVTVRQALDLLAREGLLVSQRGKLASVTDNPAPGESFLRSIEILGALTPDHRIDILERDVVDALPPAAHFFGRPSGPYVRFKKVHSEQGTPYAVMVIYVAQALAKRFPAKAETRDKLATLVQRHADPPLAGGRERITVAAADADDARLLDYPAAAPVARLRRVLCDRNGAAVYYGNVVYRGDRFGIERDHDVMVRHNFDAGPRNGQVRPTRDRKK